MTAITPDNIGRSDGYFPKGMHLIPDGNKLLLKKHEVYHEKTEGGIIIPIAGDMGNRMNKGTIAEIGEAAQKFTKLNVGDVIIYDHLATHYDWADFALLTINAVNIEEGVIVVKVFEDESIKPIGHRVLLEPLIEAESHGIMIPEQFRIQGLRGKVLGTGISDHKFAVKKNDVVIISKETPGTIFYYKSKKYAIVREDQLLAIECPEITKKTRKKKKNV